MKFYSEITSQLYNSEAELNEAESKVKKAECEKKARETKLKNERAARAKVVETAFEEYRKAKEITKKKYSEADALLEAFIRDYGTYHVSISEKNKDANKFDELFSELINTLF